LKPQKIKKMKNIWKQFWQILKWTLGLIPRFFKKAWKNKGITAVLIILGLFCWVGVISVSALVRFVSNVGHAATENVQKSPRRSSQSTNNNREQGQQEPRQNQSVGVYTTPVRNYNPQAQWISTVKMFRDQNGFFITPPGVKVNNGVPFEDFAQMHPDQARIILGH